MLVESAWSSMAAVTFSTPRTVNCQSLLFRRSPWMHFADRPFFVDRLAGLAGHALAPRPHPRAIRGARCVRIGPVLGVRWRAIHLNVLAVRPFDAIGGGEAAVGEVALRQPAEPASQPRQSGPQQAPIGTGDRRLPVYPDRADRRADPHGLVGSPEAPH